MFREANHRSVGSASLHKAIISIATRVTTLQTPSSNYFGPTSSMFPPYLTPHGTVTIISFPLSPIPVQVLTDVSPTAKYFIRTTSARLELVVDHPLDEPPPNARKKVLQTSVCHSHSLILIIVLCTDSSRGSRLRRWKPGDMIPSRRYSTRLAG